MSKERSTITSALAKPASMSPILCWKWSAMLELTPVSLPNSWVVRSSIRMGAPSAIASGAVSTAGRTSYSTSISSTASSAMCGLTAATAAIACPL